MRNGLVALGLGALGALAFACTSNTTKYAEPSASTALPTRSAICQIGTTSCQFDVADCQSYQDDQCTAAANAALASGTRQYVPGNVDPCITALNNAYGGSPGDIMIDAVTAYTTACARVFVGSTPIGGACTTATDCATAGAICATAPNQTPKCAIPTPRQIGDQCLDTGDQCPATAYCSTQGVCVAAQANGQPCSATAPCDSADRCVDGTCQALVAQGAGPCCSNSDCTPGTFCDLYTNASTSTACVDRYGFARGSVDCQGISGPVARAAGELHGRRDNPRTPARAAAGIPSYGGLARRRVGLVSHRGGARYVARLGRDRRGHDRLRARATPR